MKLVLRDDIDDQAWNRCVRKSSISVPYAQTWYLDVVAHEWDGLVLGNYQAVMPIPRKRKFGIDYSYPPFFAQQLGVFAPGHIDEELMEAFFRAIPKNLSLFQQYFNAQNPMATHPGTLVRKQNLVVPLCGNQEQQRKNYSSQTKRNLKTAKKFGLELMRNQEPKSLIELFKANKGGEIEDLKELDFKILEQLLYVAIYHRQAEIWAVYDERNSHIAGAGFLVFGNRIVLLVSASNEEGREMGAMTLLIDEVMKQSQGYMERFDFEGSSIPGLERFYKGFGAKEEIYHLLEINKLPKLVQWFKDKL